MHLLFTLLTFVLPLPPGLPWFSLPSISQEVKVVVEVEELGGVLVGSTVRVAGQTVGTVGSLIKADKAKSPNAGFKLELNILPEYSSLLKSGTVALITSPLVLGQEELGTVVDLMIPVGTSSAVLASGSRISAYTSYEKFWSADFSKSGVGQQAFQPS